MSLKNLLATNLFFVLSPHLGYGKLLAHKTRDSNFYMGNTESPAYCQIIEGKGYHLDRLYCNI